MVRELPVVAIVGRTNVGKSTLFNALAGRREAVVENRPGVTRDRNQVRVDRWGVPFLLADTGGMVGEEGDAASGLLDSVRAQTRLAISESAVVIAVLDGLSGPHPLDEEVIDALRRSNKKILWVVNKCEKPLTEVLASEFYALGLEELHPISAAHRRGVKELGGKVAELLTEQGAVEVPKEHGWDQRPIRVAVIGRPNVGKSSLINKIVGVERLITSDMPGTTRDSVDTDMVRDGQRYVLIDTAGLRKKSKVDRVSVERFSNIRTLRAMARADVVVLVLDATEGVPGDQEQKIAELVNERGKGLVIACNKWDAVEKDHRTVKQFKDVLRKIFPYTHYAPVLFISALSGRRCPSVLEKAKEVYEAMHFRVPTSDLNRVLQRAFDHRPPPVYHGDPVKLFFAVQTEVAPPTMVLFVNYPNRLSPSYQRYLRMRIRDDYPFEGVDIRFVFRKRTSKQARWAEDEAGE